MITRFVTYGPHAATHILAWRPALRVMEATELPAVVDCANCIVKGSLWKVIPTVCNCEYGEFQVKATSDIPIAIANPVAGIVVAGQLTVAPDVVVVALCGVPEGAVVTA